MNFKLSVLDAYMAFFENNVLIKKGTKIDT